MTGPAPQQLDPRILQNLQLMQKRKMQADMPAYLRDIEHVDPNQYLGQSPVSSAPQQMQGSGYGAAMDPRVQAAVTPGGGLDQQFAHGAGVIGRIATQGVGNLASMPFGLAGAAYHGMTGNQPPALLQGNQGTAAADQMGLPQYQGAGERIIGAAGENALGGAIMPGGGAATAALGAAAGAAGQGAGELGAGPMGQMAASAAVGMGIPVVMTMGAAAIQAAMAGTATRREAARQSLALLQAGDPNAPVTLGQVTQGGIGRMADAGLRKTPGASSTFRGALDAQSAGLGQRTQGIATDIGPIRDPITVGKAVQKGIENGFVPKFRATANDLYSQVDAYVPPDTPVIPSTTAGLFAQQNELAASARPLSDQIASPFMQKWGRDLAAAFQIDPTGVPFNVLKALRSRLGDVLSGAEMVSDVNTRDVKRLYGSLTDDMTRAVAEVGGPDGMQAWNRATSYWKAGTDRLENVLQPLLDKKTPEIAYNALMSGTQQGGTVLRTTMRSLQPEQQRLITSSVLGRMGMATPGAQNAAGDVFSPDRFLTQWNQLSPVAKGALFEGTAPGTSKDIDALAKAMDLVKTQNKTMPNPAGTASNVAFNSIVNAVGGGVIGGVTGGAAGKGALIGGLGTLAATGGTQQLAKQVFTNPKMIHWLVGTTKIPFGMLGRQLALLAKNSQQWDPESQAVAQQTISTLGSTDWNRAMVTGAIADAAARQTQ